MARKIAGVIFDTVLALLIVFVLSEITLRLFPQLIPPALLVNFQKDIRHKIASRVGFTTESDTLPVERDDGGPPYPRLYVYKPGVVVNKPPDYIDKPFVKAVGSRMDDSGFCNPSARAQADIVTIGDSFTWCFNVVPEDAWPARLSAISGYSVYSLGVPRIGPYDALQIFKKFGIAKSPKIVVMNIYEGNDFLGALEFQQYRAQLEAAGGNEEFAVPCVGLPGPACFIYRSLKDGPVGRTSYAFNLLANAARESVVRLKDIFYPKVKPNRRYALFMPDGKKIPFNTTNDNDWDGADELRSGKAGLEVFNDALRSFMELSRTHKFYPIVTLTSAPSTAYKGRMVFEDPEIEKLAHWYSDEQRKFFAENSEKFGYLYLDFTPYLQEAALNNEDILYFPSSGHLTEAGNAVLAKAINQFLREKNILPLPSDAP